jgi:galactonate dehydratase
MNRRKFVNLVLSSAGSALTVAPLRSRFLAAVPQMKISKVSCYLPSKPNPTYNQSTAIVTVETDQGLIGIGEGGTPEMIKQLGAMLIGEDPCRTEALWQLMYRGFFYPAGREKLHAIGALDLALWDLKGKALGLPLYSLLGGLSRNYLECYSTGFPSQGNLRETARACIESGFRAYRTAIADPPHGEPFDVRAMLRLTVENCRQIRDGVGTDGAWAIDFHTRLDQSDAVRLSSQIEELGPVFAEDLVRSENPSVYRVLRQQVKVPIAVGEQFGDRWDINELLEQHLIDYSRLTLPNTGGITEFMKMAALCETHYVGLVPHFTGPVATAGLVHVCSVFSGPVLMEMLGAGPRETPHLPLHYDFRKGKLWPNERPGLGVEFDSRQATRVAEVAQLSRPIPSLRRPDGSYTNW